MRPRYFLSVKKLAGRSSYIANGADPDQFDAKNWSAISFSPYLYSALRSGFTYIVLGIIPDAGTPFFAGKLWMVVCVVPLDMNVNAYEWMQMPMRARLCII